MWPSCGFVYTGIIQPNTCDKIVVFAPTTSLHPGSTIYINIAHRYATSVIVTASARSNQPFRKFRAYVARYTSNASKQTTLTMRRSEMYYQPKWFDRGFVRLCLFRYCDHVWISLWYRRFQILLRLWVYPLAIRVASRLDFEMQRE